MGWLIIGGTVIVVAVIAYFARDQIAADFVEIEKREASRPAPVPKKVAPVLDTSSGSPACLKCGGVQFKARRTVGQRFGIGAIGALTLPVSAGAGALVAAKGMKQRVQCVTLSLIHI